MTQRNERQGKSGVPFRVLGIDPGLTRCGIGVIDVEANRAVSLVHVGVIRTPPDAETASRLFTISRGIAEIIVAYSPDTMSVERVFAQHNLRTVMGTAQVSGVALACAAEHGIAVALHTPSEVKAALTGFGGAGKAQLGAMVARVLRLAEVPRPADAADALALAICHGWRGGAPGVDRVQGEFTPAQRAWRDAENSSRKAKL